ncbi:hypothetical protein BDR05DRAFT_949875 [Suillus weaverae]|nr:hypothetical protein BDR05DRAFT_949875 [Suillus weaverae]
MAVDVLGGLSSRTWDRMSNKSRLLAGMAACSSHDFVLVSSNDGTSNYSQNDARKKGGCMRKAQMLLCQRAHGVKKCDKEAEAISKEILRAVAKGLHGCEDDDESESDSDDSSDDDETDTLSNLPACLLAIKVAKDDMLTLIGANPCEFVKGKLGDTKGDISIIMNSIGEIEKLLKHVIHAQDKILNFCGISPEWHAADMVSQFLKTTAAYLEDIQLLEMSGGIVELTTAHWLGELIQNTAVSFFQHKKMAPRKWSTPEQEAWLRPWYEKYRTKQSDQAKNWANFFTDLLGEWLDVFPEPRPATVPPIGQLTRDKLVIMDQAEAKQKKKLENHFKNSLRSTKTGRQAKAEAANVFNAALKSVTECEKLTHSLQEVEAYSKLYYQRRVKVMVDNRLKAEAEALQAKNKVLTNGMRVAIAKKEAVNLYEGETNEVKAEVWKYIEDAKMHRDNEKEGMWSEDDYGRNIEKLAAMVNKFLTGLADATGFLFSLLAGGPSPELGGLIDVYRSNEVWEQLQSNPEFESAIMAPFKDYLHRVYHKFAVITYSNRLTNPSIAEATATLKARLGSASNDLDHDDGGDRSPISAGLGISHDDTSGQVMFNTSSQADKVPDINLPENSTDSNWLDIDDSFWEGLSAQIDVFEASGGNPNLPCLPPYPQAASTLESPSALITPPPGLPPNISPSPPITPPPGLP